MRPCFAASVLAVASLLLGCVGDSAPEPDASTDATADVAAEAASDGGLDAPSSDAADAAGDAGCGAPPFAQLTGNCAQTACLHATQITCETSPNACNTSGGRPLGCGTVGDCSSYACCLGPSITPKPGCPLDAPVNGLTNPVTTCSTNTSKACPGNQLQVCVTSAECFSGICQDTVFDFNGSQLVHFGTCR